MNRRAVNRVRGLANRLRHRRMRMDRANQFLDRALETEGQRRLSHELGGTRPGHVNAENLIGTSYRQRS